MDNIKTTPSPKPVSAPTTNIHPSPSQPPPQATSAPQCNRPPKRKLDVQDGPTHKRQQVQPPTASPKPLEACSPTFEDKEVHASPPEGANPDDGSPNPDPAQNQHPKPQDHRQQHDLPTQGTSSKESERLCEDIRDHETDNRHHESETWPSSKSQQSSIAPLSKANLKLLQQEVAGFEEMGNETASSGRGRKRPPSRQTSNSDLVSGTSGQSKEPTPSHNFYRYNILRRARIQIHPRPPPKTIQSQLDAIFKREVAAERMREIRELAEAQSEMFCNGLGGASREDDLVEVAHTALFAMHQDGTLNHCRKTDWNIDLKPSFQQLFNFSALDRLQSQHRDDGARSNKRQQADRPFPSPDTSHSTMPPPPLPATSTEGQIQDGAVKTPRPDFTIGFRDSTITEALQGRGFSQSMTIELLEALQRDGRLFSNPTQHFLELRFPVLVVEGKAYSTGRTLFEAENQAAVSGSSMLNLQQQLAKLHSTVKVTSQQRNPTLAFSVCTQGPILELWVHHLEITDDITTYHMNIIASCHGSLADELERFLLKVDCLIKWYKQDYLEEIVDQLFAIASRVAP